MVVFKKNPALLAIIPIHQDYCDQLHRCGDASLTEVGRCSDVDMEGFQLRCWKNNCGNLLSDEKDAWHMKYISEGSSRSRIFNS